MSVSKKILIPELIFGLIPITGYLLMISPMILLAIFSLPGMGGSLSIVAALFSYFLGAYGVITLWRAHSILRKEGTLNESYTIGLISGLAAAAILTVIRLIALASGKASVTDTASNIVLLVPSNLVALHWLYLIRKIHAQMPNNSFKADGVPPRP